MVSFTIRSLTYWNNGKQGNKKNLSLCPLLCGLHYIVAGALGEAFEKTGRNMSMNAELLLLCSCQYHWG